MRSLITTCNPATTALNVSSFDRLFDEAWTAPRGGRATAWRPTADVVEKNDQFVVRVDLPGVAKADVSVTVEDDSLVIKGQRASEERAETDRVVRNERVTGEFVRRFRLGNRVSRTDIKARFTDGVLEVLVPKAEEARSQLIEIE